MLLYVFFLLGIWQGVLGEDEECDKNLHEACPQPSDWRFPATEAILDRMCPEFIQQVECSEDFTSKCRPDDPEPVRKFRRDLKVLAEEACQKDSQLHSRIIENIGCLHETVVNDLPTCDKYLEKNTNIIMERINSLKAEKGYGKDEYAGELWKPFGCLIHVLETICLSTKASARCGPDTSDLVVDLVDKTGFIEMNCEPIGEEELQEYIALLELEVEEGAVLNRILGKE